MPDDLSLLTTALADRYRVGVSLGAGGITMGFYPADYFERLCPFFEPVRGREDFARVVSRARVREAEFATGVSSVNA